MRSLIFWYNFEVLCFLTGTTEPLLSTLSSLVCTSLMGQHYKGTGANDTNDVL
jgi:hypothetical protein